MVLYIAMERIRIHIHIYIYIPCPHFILSWTKKMDINTHATQTHLYTLHTEQPKP